MTLTRPYSLNIAGKHELLHTLRQLAEQENLRALIVLGQIEVLGGIIPGFGGTWRLAHRVGLQRACEMIFSAAVVDADRAKQLGLVLDVVPAEKLLSHCREVADKIAKNGKLAVAQAKKVMLAGASLPLSAALAVEQAAFMSLFGTEDQRGRMSAYVRQRDAQKQ